VIQTRSHYLPKTVELGALFKHLSGERGEGEKTHITKEKKKKKHFGLRRTSIVLCCRTKIASLGCVKAV